MRLGLEAGSHTLDLAVELGIGGVPISADALVREGLDATLEPLRERDLQVCQIGAFGYNPLSTDRERQAGQCKVLEQAISLAPQAGCRYVTICGGNYDPSGFGAGDARNWTDAALNEVAEALKPMLVLAKQYDVYICIEPYLKTVVCDPERFLVLRERVGSDALRVNLDVTSLYSYWDLWDSTSTVDHICTSLAGHYGLGHLKEVGLAEGFHIHAGLVPVGEGNTDWAQVLRLMAPHMPDDSWAILEHVQTPEEARSSVAVLRAAAEEAGVSLT